MFHRSVHINQQADRPVKPDLVENSANSFATRTARHGRNPHNSGIFTFFSLDEGSNFVQNIRQNRTSFHFRRESFFISIPTDSRIPSHRLRPLQTIERMHKFNFNSFIGDLAASILYLLDKIQVVLTV
ncbi:MAG: hypothetical protein DRJ13_16305 [Bacteroidetes bacterium]|nr:MAG: hypothetical protein DRJ13_16305 [Bacteroidota bacterium]